MVDSIVNNLQVPIGPTETGDEEQRATSRRLVWRKVRDGDKPDEIIVDLFPRASGIKTEVTAGTLSFGSSQNEDVLEFLTFNNTTRVQLKFGNPSLLSLNKVGSFRNENGGLVVTSVTFDSDTSEAVISKPAYGIVKAEYTAPYRRFTYKFAGECPSDPPAINSATGEQEEIFERATLIGIWDKVQEGKAVATLAVVNSNSRCPFPQIRGEVNNFIIELAKQDFTSKVLGSIKFQTRLQVFPAGLNPETNIAVDSASIKKCASKDITIKNEFLNFNNSAVVSIRYPLDKSKFGASNIVPDSDALVDQFGKEISPTFKFEGSEVNIVNWTSTASFETTGQSVIVKRGQVYVTDPSGNARPVFGVVRANYTITFDRYLYTHNIEEDGNDVLAAGDVFTVKKGDLVGIFPIPGKFIATKKFASGGEDCDF